MTTIAWDGETLAADSQSTQGGHKWFKEKKIFRYGDKLVAYAGREDYGTAFLQWVKAGMEPGEFPEIPNNPEGFDLIGIVVSDRGVLEFCDNGSAAPRKAPFAWGSGSHFAIGAMEAGADARQAVKVACRRDLNTGGAVQVFSLAKKTKCKGKQPC